METQNWNLNWFSDKIKGPKDKEYLESLEAEIEWLYEEIKQHQEFERKVSEFFKDLYKE